MIHTGHQIFVGYDARERLAWDVCTTSIQRHAKVPQRIAPISRTLLGPALYTRPQIEKDGRQWDVISNAPCSTDFSIARFFVPFLAGRVGWALFCDGDFMFRAPIEELFDLVDTRFAVMVVPHEHQPTETTKMDGQIQTRYFRKNWSSLALFNLQHAAVRRLDLYPLNNWTGRDLHAFKWLDNELIGFLPETWNWLDGSSSSAIDPKAVHFTRGTPDMLGWEYTKYSREWSQYASILRREAA